MSDATAREKLLEIRGLCVNFHTARGVVRAVNRLDLAIDRGETLALVGESGCGKSVTALSINGLVPSPGRIEAGEVLFEGTNLLGLSEREMHEWRGDRISMIFQEPMTSLNPVFKVGNQIADVLLTHHRLDRREAFRRAVDLLDLVKIPTPGRRAHAYPHQLSGGMRQRVMIAMALASPNPGLLIADEPTTALDVTIQAQILDLLKDLQRRIRVGILLITHDMGVVAENADRVIVMYAGRKVEEGSRAAVLASAGHRYTVGLLNSLPSNPKYRDAKRLEAIQGTVPNLIGLGDGCPFENRCPRAAAVCRQSFPATRAMGPGHSAWCHFPEQR
ncbi:MAG: ABC transporter ATP-binding protein [Spirochaetes bacterium]|nr:ABC transporter ATP-binding protein [Spirochaetota bacterium]